MVSSIYFNDNCFTFIPVVVFVITRNFIKVARNKRLNGASVTAVRVVIHPFTNKKLSSLNMVRVYVENPVCRPKRHNIIYSDYSQVLKYMTGFTRE